MKVCFEDKSFPLRPAPHYRLSPCQGCSRVYREDQMTRYGSTERSVRGEFTRTDLWMCVRCVEGSRDDS